MKKRNNQGTKVIFYKRNKSYVGFKIEGHSGYAEEGQDIVCSAVSVLSITFVNGIREVLKLDAPYSMKDGFLSIDLKSLNKEELNSCQVLMQTMKLGIENITVSYGDYVSLKIEEV